jgi:hypothetical protein
MDDCNCVSGQTNSDTCPEHGHRAQAVDRLITKGKRVLVAVSGTDDVFWTRLTKAEARQLMAWARLQLTAWIDDDGDCRIDRRSGKDDL